MMRWVDATEKKGSSGEEQATGDLYYITLLRILLKDIATVVFMLISLIVLSVTGELLSLYYPNLSRRGQLCVSA